MRWMPLEKFQRLLAKAEAEGITLSPVPRSDTVMFATSGNDPKRRYIVSDNGCDCAAGINDVDCKHYALFIFEHLPRLITTYGKPPWIGGADAESVSMEESEATGLRAGA